MDTKDRAGRRRRPPSKRPPKRQWFPANVQASRRLELPLQRRQISSNGPVDWHDGLILQTSNCRPRRQLPWPQANVQPALQTIQRHIWTERPSRYGSNRALPGDARILPAVTIHSAVCPSHPQCFPVKSSSVEEACGLSRPRKDPCCTRPSLRALDRSRRHRHLDQIGWLRLQPPPGSTSSPTSAVPLSEYSPVETSPEKAGCG